MIMIVAKEDQAELLSLFVISGEISNFCNTKIERRHSPQLRSEAGPRPPPRGDRAGPEMERGRPLIG